MGMEQGGDVPERRRSLFDNLDEWALTHKLNQQAADLVGTTTVSSSSNKKMKALEPRAVFASMPWVGTKPDIYKNIDRVLVQQHRLSMLRALLWFNSRVARRIRESPGESFEI